MPNAIIAGTGSYAPEHVVPNQYFDRVGSNDAWIQERLGIKERRISQGETTSELATKAAQRALDMAGVAASELDLGAVRVDDWLSVLRLRPVPQRHGHRSGHLLQHH